MASNHEADLFVRSLPRRQVVSSAGLLVKFKSRRRVGRTSIAVIAAFLSSFLRLLVIFAIASIGFRLNTAEPADFFLSDDFPPQVVKVFFCD